MGTSADWSPDGSTIVFTRGDQHGANNGLWLMKPDGTDLRQLASPPGVTPSTVAWSPNGTWIAFVASTSAQTALCAQTFACGLYKAHADGSGFTRVTQTDVYGLSAAWSQDSTRLALVEATKPDANEQSDYSLSVINADGTGEHTIIPAAPRRYFSGPAWA
jgi:Tol biopolymer transport system component